MQFLRREDIATTQERRKLRGKKYLRDKNQQVLVIKCTDWVRKKSRIIICFLVWMIRKKFARKIGVPF